MIARHDRLPPASSIALGDAGARDREIRRARFHSRLVAGLKFGLPAAAVALLGLYVVDFGSPRTSATSEAPRPRLDVGRIAGISADGLTMANPKYQGFGQDGSQYEVTAATAVTSGASVKGPIKLDTIKGRLVQASGSVTYITAAAGTMDPPSQVLQLSGGIRIENDANLTARLSTATVEPKLGRITSRDPVLVSMPAGEVRGNSMILLHKQRQVTFGDGVATRLTPPPSKGGAGDRAALEKRSLSPFAVGANRPIDVTARTLVIADTSKLASFSGGVSVRQDNATLTSSELDITYAGAPLPGAQPAVGSEAKPDARIKSIVARHDVVVTRGADKIMAPELTFDGETEVTNLTGGIVITGAGGRRATGQRLIHSSRTNVVELIGQVVIVQGENMLRGRRLTADTRAQTFSLTAGDGESPRIAARFKQPKSASRPARKAPKSELGGLSFKTNPDAPIEIDASRLDGDDKAHRAVFRGDVRAVQGELSIQTAEMTVVYKGGNGLGSALSGSGGKPANAGAGPGGAAQLERIIARQRVVITSGSDRSATGDWAEFDVASNTATVGGNVVLTQGRQVIRGPKLTIDMKTGQALMQATAESAGQPSRGSARENAASGQCGGRMCAVFYPSELKAAVKSKPSGDGRTAAPRPPASSSWSADTTVAPKSN